MKINELITQLKHSSEILPDEYDGCYKLVRNTVKRYENLRNKNIIDYSDLDLIYSLCVKNSVRGISLHKENVQKSHLLHADKKMLDKVIDETWAMASKKKFAYMKDSDEIYLGIFDAPFKSFKNHTIASQREHIRNFIDMCLDIVHLNRETDEEIYVIAESILDAEFAKSELSVAVVSRILHCIKPFTFPIISDNEELRTIFDFVGIGLENTGSIETYISNCRKIKEYRDRNLKVRNYRIYQLAEEDFTVPEPEVKKSAAQEEVVPPEEEEITLPNHSLNRILYGPPGTGKTYNTVKHAVALVEGKESVDDEDYEEVKKRFDKYSESGRIKFTTFHQSYSYEEFVEGIRPVIVDKYGKESTSAHSETSVVYRVYDGVFKTFCERAKKNPHIKYVAVIDEINRGNISKIFGELITLIEDSKRGMSVTLPFSQKEFTVPPNVYLLGTMNTADRSIAMLDTALRRRFDFTEMMPVPELLGMCGEVNLREMLTAINQRIEYYYDREHTIGHAYFMTRDGSVSTLDELRHIFAGKVIPLLQEYFFDDYDKIKLVLNDENTFIESHQPKYIKVFDSEQNIYRIADKDKWTEEDFINIYR